VSKLNGCNSLDCDQAGWGNKAIVREAFKQIISLNAQAVILARGELIERDVNAVLRAAWHKS